MKPISFFVKPIERFAAVLGIVAIAALVMIAGASCARCKAATAAPDKTQGPWLFSYFTGNGEDGLHLAYSRDGLAWENLAGSKSVYNPQVGSQKLVRDPCVAQGPDGSWQMTWTTGWQGRDIGHASSPDLIHWSAPQVIPVMAAEPKAINCWAPEVIWDPEANDYLIYWSTTILHRFPKTNGQDANKIKTGFDHRIYCTTTPDFKTFSPTRLLYNPGFNCIDATIQPTGGAKGAGGEWIMIVKDETGKPFKAQKNLRVAFASHAAGPYGPASAPITGKDWVEGPTLFKAGARWIVMFDKFKIHRYGAMTSPDLEHWTDVSGQLKYPEGLRHGTAFAVPEATLQALLALQ